MFFLGGGGKCFDTGAERRGEKGEWGVCLVERKDEEKDDDDDSFRRGGGGWWFGFLWFAYALV